MPKLEEKLFRFAEENPLLAAASVLIAGLGFSFGVPLVIVSFLEKLF